MTLSFWIVLALGIANGAWYFWRHTPFNAFASGFCLGVAFAMGATP